MVLAILMAEQVIGERLRVMVLAEPGSTSEGLRKASRFTYFNISAEGNERFQGFTIDVMSQVRAEHPNDSVTLKKS